MRVARTRHSLLSQALVALLAFTVIFATEAPAPARQVDSMRHGRAVEARQPRPSRAAERAPRPTDGSAWTGFAFDACRAPSQRAMDRWRRHSPFLGVGIYIGGPLRACEQPHLTPRWVSRQLRGGWKLLPLWVGPQGSCTGYRRRIDAHPGAAGRYPGARRQGITAARGASAAARRLAIPAGTTLWYDIEPFSTRRASCRRSALRFLSSWTLELHRRGYRSGVYSTLNAAVAALAHAPARGPRRYATPDHVWFAWVNHRADSWIGGRRHLHRPGWKLHRRVHQFALDTAATYGGIRMHIDRNFVDLGRPGRAVRGAGPCGPAADRRSFPVLQPGTTGSRVRAAQCLLRFAGRRPAASEQVFGAVTRQVLRGFQHARRLRATGRTDRPTWTALLATGSRPVVKRGSAGAPVRRLQRALNAALPGSIPVSGVFGARTASRVRHYQARVGQPVTGVVATRTWSALSHGVLSRPHRHHGSRHAHPGHRRAHSHGAAKPHHAKHDGKHPAKHPAKHPGRHHRHRKHHRR